mmetsp:Transcript_33390/g.50508  ORF Transcript_33390/g.50508 Transcript_33390/m.50508 type:complete len:182 (-) Transcript_33390:85-630(-)|eukprot:CAMPEP_0206459282 /NCGR_PEP_ID=MMETSP0324_2-20121206/24087_1 /ASSEMBLY_ACC=CAM_ASM_000836 /TAXON_ID=2866 /ORGANISM="Crypthecodinium cohnii, Strain Seligo" /LENGTH=181 /DNA_ID=CAMNT_0053930811 /DNA_START=100 /DNA_END=645 /DNA_ORIENTATION=-
MEPAVIGAGEGDNAGSGGGSIGLGSVSPVALCCQSILGLVGLGLFIANFVFYGKADENCDSEPVKMKTVFLVNGLIGLLPLVLIILLIVVAVAAMMSGDGEPPAWAQGVMGVVGVLTGCSVCCLCLGGIAWFIIGIVSVVDANDDENEAYCKDEVTWFWVAFGINIALVCCTNAQAAVNKK